MGFTRENAAHYGALGGKKSKRISTQEKKRLLRMTDLARLRQILDGEHGKELQLGYLNTIKEAWGIA
ncbi:hypothetical protein NTE16_001806 [Vibrio mimicus]